MFDIGFDEMLVIAIVAIVVIGPKDLPLALRSVGRWVAKLRRVSGHFRSGIETMIRDAELEEMEKKWRDQNAAIMEAHPHPQHDSTAADAVPAASAEAALTPPTARDPESRDPESRAEAPARRTNDDTEPSLPFPAP